MGTNPEALNLKRVLNTFIPEQCRHCRNVNNAALNAATVAIELCIEPVNAHAGFAQTIGEDCEVGLTLKEEGMCHEEPICNHPRKDQISATNWPEVYQGT